MLRPLSPNTKEQYAKALARGLSDSESSRKLLRAALKRQALEQGVDPQVALAQVPAPAYLIKRVHQFMNEAEALAYEQAAQELAPGRRALALLPLALGLRASTLLELERQNVERGARDGALKLLLKRGKEALIDCRGAHTLLEELLSVPSAPGRQTIKEKRTTGRRAWKAVGEILSPGKRITQYHLLHDLVRGVGARAGIPELHPHALRHAFASRMLRDGATVADIQYALGHESPQTTMIYIHGDPSRLGKFMRQF